MKRMVAMVVGGALLMGAVGAQSIEPVTKDLGPDVDAMSHKITQELIYGDQPVLYKKHHHVSAILQGLAGICMNLAQFIGGDNRNKQQAVMGVVGTVLGTAAQLSATTSNKQNKPLVQAEFELKIINLTDMILEEQPVDGFVRSSSSSYLTMLKGTERSARPGWIRLILSSGKAKAFMRELLAATGDYLRQHAPEIAEFFKQRARDYLQREGLIHPTNDGALQRADELLVDSVSRTVMVQSCDEMHNLLLADLKDETLQQALVERLPQHRDFAQVCQSVNNLLETIQQEISWLMLFLYGAYGQFAQLFQTIDNQIDQATTTTPNVTTVVQAVASDVSTAANIVATNASVAATHAVTVATQTAAQGVAAAGVTPAVVGGTIAAVNTALATAAGQVATVASTVAVGAQTLASTASTVAATTANVNTTLNAATAEAVGPVAPAAPVTVTAGA